MYNRVITIDTTHPAATLTELVVGRFSALMLYIKGVPTAMASVKFVITDGDDGVEFVGDRETAAGGMDAGLWSVYVRGGYQAEVGSRHYEVRLFDEGGVLYWSGHGILKTIENATSVAPADVGPTGPTGGPGPTGPIGPTGGPGPTGATGPTGRGEKGDSGVWVGEDEPPEGYDVWIDPEGNEAVGPTGPTGATGEPGKRGDPGADGAPGPTGATGPAGRDSVFVGATAPTDPGVAVWINPNADATPVGSAANPLPLPFYVRSSSGTWSVDVNNGQLVPTPVSMR